MREILFRGKIKGIIDWKYGSYAKCIDDHYILEDSDAEDNWSIVDPETVGQFTGLTDKNGVKVFEGDILRSEYNGVDMIVKFGSYPSYCPADKQDCQATGFYAENIDNKDCPLMPIGEPSDYGIVIGNIHDNPELLEDK